MHKKAMELAKTLAEKLGKEDICSLTNQDYENAKNISEITKNLICAEKDYLIVEAMKESEEEEKLMNKLGMPQNERMGYNNRRYANGRYAPKGSGMRMGYNPYLYMTEDGYMDEYLNDPNFMTSENRRMGYNESGNRMNGTNRGNSRYGYVFDEYRDKKRHFTETQTPEEKVKLKEHREKTVDAILDMVGEVWKDMDVAEKDIVKNKFLQKML